MCSDRRISRPGDTPATGEVMKEILIGALIGGTVLFAAIAGIFFAAYTFFELLAL